jgi:hypothetical protein
MEETLKDEWGTLVKKLEIQFGEGIGMEGILLLIGIQELGQGYRKFSKDEKLDVLHIAICTLLEPLGYYTYTGKDAQGWPHWDAVTTLPPLKSGEQLMLVKQAVVEYFKETEEEELI